MRFIDQPEQSCKREPIDQHAAWEAVSVAAGVVPGSVAELRLGGASQPYFLWWLARHHELVDRVRSGVVECCGECERPGYYGWCSLLSRPRFTRQIGVDELDRPVWEWCDKCPKFLNHPLDASQLATTEAIFGAVPGASSGSLTEGELEPCKS